MSIDLKYLLILQGLRAVTGGIYDEFFNGLSKLDVDIQAAGTETEDTAA